MADKIMIRVYNVGLGDCVYVQVPDGEGARHILIDCGTFAGGERLERVLNDLEENHLPSAGGGRSRLDLLVVTHNHKDHLSGFGHKALSARFQNIDIGRIWLSAGMNPAHPQAGKTFRLLDFAERSARALSAIELGPAFSGLASDLLSARGDSDGESNAKALTMLRQSLPRRLPEQQPLYVDDGLADGAAGLFSEPETRLRVLAPAHDIDGTYLGRLGEALAAFERFQFQVGNQKKKSRRAAADLVANRRDPSNHPANIGAGDFQRLRERLLYQALAFAIKGSGDLMNNTSVVLLLEWRKKRLLFAGDAQCVTGRKNVFIAGAVNGSWNAMWHRHKKQLERPLDFLKVGHHGSHNATPWAIEGTPDPVNAILDCLLPPAGSDCRVVVSTERAQNDDFRRTLPRKELMLELGKRLRRPEKRYDEAARYPDLVDRFGSCFVPAKKPQPLRTDLHGGDAVTVTIS